MKIDHLTPIEQALAEMGKRLAQTRKQQGLSQEDLAAAAGIGVATLRRIEGGNDSQMGSWIKVFQGLGITDALDNLLSEDLRSPFMDAKTLRKKQKSKMRKLKANSSAQAGPWSKDAP